MKEWFAIIGTLVIGIYLASIMQWHGAVVGTEHLMWILGAAILGGSVGLLLFDP